MEKTKQMSSLVMWENDEGNLKILLVTERNNFDLRGVSKIYYSNNMLFIEQLNGQIMGINMNQIVNFVVSETEKDE